MDKDVVVSVVMPAYNSEKYIEESIESIINQSYKKWELIIVEDCSTDDTMKKIQKYKYLDNIRVIKNDSNMGIAYSTNKAINYSIGKYIALIDDDDVSLPDRLQLQVDYLSKHTNIDILGGRCITIDSNGNLITYGDEPKSNPNFIRAELLFKMVNIANSTLMFRKKFFTENGLQIRDNCYGIQDLAFYKDCALLGTMTSIEQPLTKWRKHNTNTTDKMFKDYYVERKKIYKKIQNEHIKKSGYDLTIDEYSIINKAFAERNGKCNTIDELNSLYNILNKMIVQCENMNKSYLVELKKVCVNLFSIQLKKYDVFSNCNVILKDK